MMELRWILTDEKGRRLQFRARQWTGNGPLGGWSKWADVPSMTAYPPEPVPGDYAGRVDGAPVSRQRLAAIAAARAAAPPKVVLEIVSIPMPHFEARARFLAYPTRDPLTEWAPLSKFKATFPATVVDVKWRLATDGEQFAARQAAHGSP